MAVKIITKTVIGGGDHGEPYGAAVGATQSFQIDAGGRVGETWYVPVDNLPDLVHFGHIDVVPNGNQVTLTIRPISDALLQIWIYADVA